MVTYKHGVLAVLDYRAKAWFHWILDSLSKRSIRILMSLKRISTVL